MKPRKEIWQDIRDREQRIAEGPEMPGVELLVRHVHQLIGGYCSAEAVLRWYGYHADLPEVQGWIGRPAGWEVVACKRVGTFGTRPTGPIDTQSS